MDKEIKKEFENLGRMVKAGFDGVYKEFNNRFDIVDKKIEELRQEILEIKASVGDIKLRMSEMAFKFEIKDIEKRLKRLEIKAGLIGR